jgi:hypothetical protein
MVNTHEHDHQEECSILVYRCTMCPPSNDAFRHFVVDCEPHEVSRSIDLFAGALGMALLHRSAAIR